MHSVDWINPYQVKLEKKKQRMIALQNRLGRERRFKLRQERIAIERKREEEENHRIDKLLQEYQQALKWEKSKVINIMQNFTLINKGPQYYKYNLTEREKKDVFVNECFNLSQKIYFQFTFHHNEWRLCYNKILNNIILDQQELFSYLEQYIVPYDGTECALSSAQLGLTNDDQLIEYYTAQNRKYFTVAELIKTVFISFLNNNNNNNNSENKEQLFYEFTKIEFKFFQGTPVFKISYNLLK